MTEGASNLVVPRPAHALKAHDPHARSADAEALAVQLRARFAASESLVRVREPMAPHTTLRLGGPADWYVEPACEADLGATLAWCREHHLPWIILGRGSNLIVRDGGIRGMVIRLAHSGFGSIRTDGCRIHAGAGARLRAIATEALKQGLTGLEFLEGIPGSLGGALRMNAGAMGACIFPVIERVRLMHPDGALEERTGPECRAVYRECGLFRECIALAATLLGRPAADAEIRERMAQYSRRRWETQPTQRSAGCMFRNPPELPAGKLIDELGLKGLRIGDAMVSDVHANFIVNLGQARAQDVLALIHSVQARALAQRGITLIPEVEIVGEDDPDAPAWPGQPPPALG